MSLVFCDGFDDNLSKWDNVAPGKLAGGRNGQCAYIGGGATVTKSLGSDAHQTMVVGFAFQANDLPFGSHPYLRLLGSDGSIHFEMRDIANSYARDFQFVRNGTVVYTWSSSLVNLWYYVEVKLLVSDTVGTLTVRIDGNTVFSQSNVDTKAGTGTDTVNAIFLGSIGGANGGPWMCDDLYVCNGAGTMNNDFLGDLAIETLYPSGDGDLSQWIGSDGNSISNYQLVDEAGTPSMTDYVQSDIVGNRDLYQMQDLTRATGIVRGVMVSAHLSNSDSGTRAAAVSAKSGATVSTGTGVTLAYAPSVSSKIMEVNPDTASVWSVADINSLQVGAEVTT